MKDDVIAVNNLTRRFGDITAVSDLNLTVHRGEMLALVGPDGAGKTTTIRMLCGISEPSSGTIRILGYDAGKDMNEIKKHIGYLSQRFSLYGDLSIDENIEFFAEIHRVKDYKIKQEELLKFTRLSPFRNRLAERLSGGMRQKLALACTLIHTPKILFLDEPTTGVDPVSRRDFWKILSSILKEGMTIVMTTPYLDEAERCTRVGLINKGSLMVVDTPQNIKKLMKGNIIEIVCTPIRKAFTVLKRLSFVSEIQAFGDRLNIVVADKDRHPLLAKNELRSEGIKVADYRVIPPSLENVFISLIKSN